MALNLKQPSLNKLALLLFLVLLSQTLTYASDDDLRLEGVVYESKNPAESMAVIEGNFYRKGEHYKDYEIIEVRADRITARDNAGKTTEHRIQSTEKKNLPIAAPQAVTISPDAETQQKKAVEAESGEKTPPQNWADQILKQLGLKNVNFDPSAMMNQLSSIQLTMDLKKLYMQAAVAASESDGQTMSLQDLIAKGQVDPAYGENKNGYVYKIELAAEGPQVFASPVHGNEKSKHYMIDAWGNLRIETGRPATAKSPLAQSTLTLPTDKPTVGE